LFIEEEISIKNTIRAPLLSIEGFGGEGFEIVGVDSFLATDSFFSYSSKATTFGVGGTTSFFYFFNGFLIQFL
jgi:hypothetical protein